MKRVWFCIGALWLLVACDKNPFERTRDASGGGPAGAFGAGRNYVIFNNELTSGGGAFEYPGGENQTLTFSDRSNPVSQRSIRYAWNGGPAVSGSSDHTFAGFTLIHTSLQSQFNLTPGRDLHLAGYAKATFYARGSLSSNTVIKIEAADDSDSGTPDGCMILSTNGTDTDLGTPTCSATAQLTANWRQYTLPVPSFSNVKDFFKATFVFKQPDGFTNPGQGGTAYFDVIQYEP